LGEEPVGELLLVAWDTGWAAMKALLQELDGRARTAPAHRMPRMRLLLGADAPSGLYDTEYPTGLERRRPWLTVVPVTGEAPGEDLYGGLAHAVTQSGLPAVGRALLAGPPAIIQTVTAALLHTGLPAEHILHDLLPP